VDPAFPFISQDFAQKLARLVIEEKYPKDMFSAPEPGTVVDKGEAWWVTVDNALASQRATLPKGAIIPRGLTIQIRKSNGEILAIS
jgi:hypothetical protein